MKTSNLSQIHVGVVVLLVLISFVYLLLPDLTQAQTAPGGLVTCNGTDCSACNFVEMINLGIVILFGAVGLIFAVIMMKAGFGLVTSGGNPGALTAAKDHFQNALVGLLIVMAAWLFVDVIMRTTLRGGEGNLGATFSGWGPWSQVQCQTQTDTVPFVDRNTGHGGTPVETGQGQVPGSTEAGTCSVPPLTAMTDPLAIRMEQGNAVVFNNPTLQQCAQRFISQVGGGARINSAYRPAQYQTHLYEIRNRWCDGASALRYNNTPECSAFRSAISAEVNRHFGANWQCGAVGVTSRHSESTAVDIGGISNHADARVQAAASANCLAWRNYPGDPWHYDLRPGCTCN